MGFTDIEFKRNKYIIDERSGKFNIDPRWTTKLKDTK